MQFGKVPTLKGGGAESNKECAPISGIFVDNGQFSKKECAPISQTSKIAFPISKTIINRDTGRDTLWIWRDTDYQIVIQVVILCRFGVIQLFLK